MGGDALHVRPGTDAQDAVGIRQTDFFVAVLLGHTDRFDHPVVSAAAAQARADARAAVRAGREPARSEDLVALRIAYAQTREAAAAVKPARRSPEGPRWARALGAVAALRHRQRAALSLYFGLGLTIDEVASVLGARPAEARKVVEAGIAQAVKALGEPFDVRRGLRIAGSRIVSEPEAIEEPVQPTRMPRAVFRTLLAPVPDIVSAEPERAAPEAEEPAASEAEEPAAPEVASTPAEPKEEPQPALPPSRPLTLMPALVPEPLVSDEVLARLEAEGSVITPDPKTDIVPRARRARRAPSRRRHLSWAAAVVVMLLAALLPAGAEDGAVPSPLDPVRGAGQQASTGHTSTVVHEDVAPEAVVPAKPEVIRVRRGDSLWALAGRHLDDPLRWREIWRLNRNRVMPGGERFTDPNLIRPAWRLRLPPRRG